MKRSECAKFVRTRYGRRRWALGVLVAGLLAILLVECSRQENRALITHWLEVTQRERVSDPLEDLTRRELLPGLDPKLFALVEENSPIFSAEAPAAAQIVTALRDLTPEDIHRHCVGRVLFAQYSEQPETYRGNVVRLNGVVRRVRPEKFRNPIFGVERLYGVWIQPDDCPKEPVLVYCLGLPEGCTLPMDADVEAKIALDAVFYKNYNYVSHSGVRCAPMFYAKAPEWLGTPAPEAAAQKPQPAAPFLPVLLASLLLAAVAWLVIEFRTRRPEPEEPLPETFEVPQAPTPPQDATDVLAP